MSTIFVPAKDVGALYPDAIPAVQQRPSGASVAAFSALMGEPVGPVADLGSTPQQSNSTTTGDAFNEWLQFSSANFSSSSTPVPGSSLASIAAASASSSGSASSAVEAQASSVSSQLSTSSSLASARELGDGKNYQFNAPTLTPEAAVAARADAAALRAQQLNANVAATAEKKPSFVQMVRRQFAAKA